MKKKINKTRRRSISSFFRDKIDRHQIEFRQKERANWSELVPEIAFVLLKCDAVHKRRSIDAIAEEACGTYPGVFETRFNGKKIPDYSLVLLTLDQAKKRQWRYAAGDWFKGWRLTKRGAAFARDVQRHRDARLQHLLAA
jgi:hypothetical protein